MTVIVVGSGLAGLAAALAMAPQRCILLTPGRLGAGSASMLAQGGFSAATGTDDSPALHAEDTWLAGDRAGEREVIDRICAEAPAALQRLIALGVPFDRNGGALDLHLEGGHRRHRIAHVGDSSGAAITQALVTTTDQSTHVEVHEHTRVIDLLVESGHIAGVRVRTEHEVHDIAASAVILATGGYGALFAHATSPSDATGSGIALAARAGARTDDLHFVQFHPTALDWEHVDSRPMALLTEALRGAGATLLSDGQRFVDELRPRDQVAAAVWQQIVAGHRVHLDARHVAGVTEHFPGVTALCRDAGLDPADDLVPTRPAAHYSMGGITVDARGRSSLPGLWAVGECSRTGLHGANRLASNSLLEAFVTGRAAGTDAASWRWQKDASPHWADVAAADPETVVSRAPGRAIDFDAVRATLDRGCGVLRRGPELARTMADLAPSITCDDAAYLAWLVARSALADPRSRGAHRRIDHEQEASA